jgi:hypothetical protein
MSTPAKQFVRLTRNLPLDPAHGCLKGTIWEVVPPPQGESSMKTWIRSAAGREVALLRHEWEECLAPCPHCRKPGEVVPGVKRGLFIGQCSETIDCEVWPMTEPKASEQEAADAWNRGDILGSTAAQLANAE